MHAANCCRLDYHIEPMPLTRDDAFLSCEQVFGRKLDKVRITRLKTDPVKVPGGELAIGDPT